MRLVGYLGLVCYFLRPSNTEDGAVARSVCQVQKHGLIDNMGGGAPRDIG